MLLFQLFNEISGKTNFRVSNTPSSIYKIKNVTKGRSWERMGISKAKEEESYPRSQFCPGKCKQWWICTHVHILILNIGF